MIIDAVLFDLYGTLLDVQTEEDTPAFWAALARHVNGRDQGLDPSSLRQIFMSSLHDERSRLPDGFVMHSVFQRVLSACGRDADEAAVGRFATVFRALSIRKLSLRPYSVALVKAIKNAACKCAIVSNTEGVLTRYDISQFATFQDVDAIVLSSEVGFKKPEQQIFEIALRKVASTADSAIFVGDNWDEDIGGARRLGLRAVHVSAAANQVCFLEGSPQAVVAPPDLASLLEALRKLGWNDLPQYTQER